MNRLLPALLLLAALPARADIYKWVDESGRTHFGEEPPAKYMKKATALTPQPTNTIPGDKLRGNSPARSSDAEAGAESSHSEAPPPPDTGKPADTPLDCQGQWQKFRDSQACFARYRNANGSLRVEAKDNCENMEQPPACE